MFRFLINIFLILGVNCGLVWIYGRMWVHAKMKTIKVKIKKINLKTNGNKHDNRTKNS